MTVRYLDFNNWKFNWITNPINQTNPRNQFDSSDQFDSSQSQRSRRMRLAMAIAMAAGQTRGRSGKAEESVITN